MSNNRLAYGLAAQYGIDTKDKSPHEVWEALKKLGKVEDIFNSEGEKSVKAKGLDEFLAERELVSPFADYTIDKIRLPHGETARQKSARLEATNQAIVDYSKKRNKAISEYKGLVQSGELREPSSIEKALRTAKGHEDNSSVQAARRFLKKNGIDWETGEKIKETTERPKLSPLEAFKENARQFNEALNQARQNGYSEVVYKDIEGTEAHRYWSGGRWEEEPSSMYAMYGGGRQKGVYYANFKI